MSAASAPPKKDDVIIFTARHSTHLLTAIKFILWICVMSVFIELLLYCNRCGWSCLSACMSVVA